jgi:hypothetical protein
MPNWKMFITDEDREWWQPIRSTREKASRKEVLKVAEDIVWYWNKNRERGESKVRLLGLARIKEKDREAIEEENPLR